MSLTCLTITGDRHDCFRLSELFMSRQSVRPDRWIVIDDGETPAECTMGQQVIRLQPGKPPHESFVANMTAGLAAVETDNVAFWEDDDRYHPAYLLWLRDLLPRYEMVGECPAIYFNREHRLIRGMGNTTHAGLCSTSCRTDIARKALKNNPRGAFFDLHLWGMASSHKHLLTKDSGGSQMVVGMKGHPTGRKGIGVGHRPRGNWTPDPNLERLALLIGPDVELYR